MLEGFTWGPGRETHVLLRRLRFLGHPSSTLLSIHFCLYSCVLTFFYCFVHTSGMPSPSFPVTIYVPMPPARYLSRKSPMYPLIGSFGSPNARSWSPLEGIVPWNVTLIRLVQYEKVYSLILVTPLPMITLVRLPQYWKAPLSMLVTLFGTVLQFSYAYP